MANLIKAKDSILRNQFAANLIVRHSTVNVEKDTALIHHTIQNHEADVPCFACNQAIPSLSELSDHIKSKHEKALIVCVYCKSVFGRANDMTENQWKRLKTHMYGELVYAKLAEMQD
nr:Hypothetical protein CBG24152 [Haemonchus contortus]